MVIPALLATLTTAYDNGIKPCWNIRLSSPTSFCYESVKYDVSTPVFYDATERDEEARRMYNVLREKWDLGGKGSPSNHCLAIARDFYCFNLFPRCEGDEK